jgi:hypothetical protein
LHVQELVATSQQFRLVLLIELGQVRKQKIQVKKRSQKPEKIDVGVRIMMGARQTVSPRKIK